MAQRTVPVRGVSLGVFVLTTALSACGGSSSGSAPSASSDPAITQSNAATVAAEATLSPSSLSYAMTTGANSASSPASVVANSLRVLDKRMIKRLSAGATTRTGACTISGSFTTTTSADAKTFSVAFADCIDVQGVTLNGTQTYTGLATTISDTLESLTAGIADDLTLTLGTVAYTASGAYQFSLSATLAAGVGLTKATFELTGTSLAITVESGGATTDSETLTNFDLNFVQDDTVTPQELSSSYAYTLASSKLPVPVTVATLAALKQYDDVNAMAQYPYTGQLLVSSTESKERLQVTILGDETYTPPAGQGQVELQLDPGAGTFNVTLWTNWAQLGSVET